MPNFNAHTPHHTFREPFPSQPINLQPRPNYQPPKFLTNAQVSGKQNIS